MSDISETYEAQYPAAEEHGKRLAMELDGDVQGLRGMVTALRSTITGTSVRDAVRVRVLNTLMWTQ